MAWDDELDELATYVKAHFGTEVLKDAGRRALATLTTLDLAEPVDAEEVIEGANGNFYDVDEFWEAVRRELRRLVTPQ